MSRLDLVSSGCASLYPLLGGVSLDASASWTIISLLAAICSDIHHKLSLWVAFGWVDR